MTEVAAFDMAAIAVDKDAGEQTLNALESRTQEIGNAILKPLFQAQRALMDRQLTEAYIQEVATPKVWRDGHEMVTVATPKGKKTSDNGIIGICGPNRGFFD
jgi:hypothetical protein